MAKSTPDTLLSVELEKVLEWLSCEGETGITRPFGKISPEEEESEIFLVGGRDQCLPGTLSWRLLVGGGTTERGKLWDWIANGGKGREL